MAITADTHKHLKALISQLQASHPFIGEFTYKFTGRAKVVTRRGRKSQTNATCEMDARMRLAICTFHAVADQPLHILLRGVAHEYAHAVQQFGRCQDTLTLEAEIEACTFGFQQAARYCMENGLPCPPYVLHPAIDLKVTPDNAYHRPGRFSGQQIAA